ncbi:MAG: polysaccharide biosynthesis protein [Bdellovibrionales bacterium]
MRNLRLLWDRINWRHLLPDLAVMIFSFYAALYLRVETEGFVSYAPVLTLYLPLFLLINVVTFTLMGVYDIIWRYVSAADAVKLIKATSLATALLFISAYLLEFGMLPRSFFFIYLFLVTAFMGSIRLVRRVHFEQSYEQKVRESGRRTLIFGAGANGRTMAHRFQTDDRLGFQVIGFIDDDQELIGRNMLSIKVLGHRQQMSQLINDYQISEVIIAVNNPPAEVLRNIIEICLPHQIRPRLITDVSKQGGSVSTFQLFREINLSDLLNRSNIDMDVQGVKELIRGKTVLVTGAGGSIGSELCRQIFNFNPARLLLLDNSEYNLYQIDQELRVSPSERSLIVPLLVDVKDRSRVMEVFKDYSPDIVFHAAAYKHVHLVESNPYTSIINNIRGTKNVLELSEMHGVEDFVLISTDKAVNPAGVMGSTKRACELMVNEFGKRTGYRYCAVRFGNVLGSSGSLIPKLKQQIENDEPLTITHQEMTRYFMLIQEAVALVLKAASIAKPGEIAILRMGEPVKIVDIAKNLIALMGKTETQIPIIFTGMRPGEKMFEELYLSGNEINTEHPDVLILPRAGWPANVPLITFEYLERRIEEILELASQSNKEALSQLNSLVKAQLPAHVDGVVDGLRVVPMATPLNH